MVANLDSYNASRLPVKQTIRALCCCYMVYCLWMGWSMLPLKFLMTHESTWLAVGNILGISGLYICLSNRTESRSLVAWIHTFNSMLVFVNFWYCALYWNLLRHQYPYKAHEAFVG